MASYLSNDELRYWVLAGLVAALPISASAQTQTDLGSHISRPKSAEIPARGYTKEEQGRVTLQEYARCVFASWPEQSSQALMLAPDADSEALNGLAKSKC